MIESLLPPEYPVPPLPNWVTQLRGPQVRAVNRILEAFDTVDLVIVDAPVGTGKTLIGELTRRELGDGKGVERCVYVCTDKSLQDQFARDFEYGKVLKGRANYIPVNVASGKVGKSITCDDCQAESIRGKCSWCPSVFACPYQVAKQEAKGAELAVYNTALFLTLCNYTWTKDDQPYDLVIADEADLLEGSLIGFIEFEIPQWVGREMGLQYPIKGARKQTIVNWLDGLIGELEVFAKRQGEPKKARAVRGLIGKALRVKLALEDDLADGDIEDGDREDRGHWVRDYKTETFKMRPVMVSGMAQGALWRYGKKWLLMSGTVVSAEEMVESLGWDEDYEVVTVPSTFPVENRKVVAAPVANLTRAVGERDWGKVVTAIERILEKHEGRALIHTVSYALTKYLGVALRHRDGQTREVIWHETARDKHGALQRYKQTPEAVLLSPSMQRGVDLHGDLCRVQIIVKCPFPNLGDVQVSSRLRLPGGDLWYAVNTVREIVQMTGRGVRSKEDWCKTYILDEQFTRNIWRRHKRLFVKSFVDAVETKGDIRWLM